MEYVYVGKKHYITDAEGNVRRLQGGEIVELTPEQARNFRDKFRPVQSAPEAVVEQDEETPEELQARLEARGDSNAEVAPTSETPVETTE